MFYTYILQSELDNSYYIGHTGNLIVRLHDHNQGLSKYTRNKRPWQLVYQEEFETRSDAMRREYFLKKQRNSNFYKRLIDGK